MRYFYLEPEVAGSLGKNTIMNRSVHPPVVAKLHYQLEGWLGDDLLESFPCYIVTRQLRDKIRESQLTGAGFGQLEITTSDEFKELHPKLELPDFFWLTIHGKAGPDDFGIATDNRLVVSEKALALLRSLNLNHCEVLERK
jgi:hypothetical protein